MYKKIGAMLLTVCVLCGTFISCGKKTDENVLVVNVPNGGYGLTWINEIISDWENDNPGWTIDLRKKKTAISTFTADVETGTDINIFYTSGIEFQEGIYKDLFLDLSGVLEMKPDGDDSKTVKEKIIDFDAWQKAGSKNGEGFYIMPWTDAIGGLVYDHDMFVENGWLSFADWSDDNVKAALTEQGITYERSGKRIKFVSSAEPCNYESGDFILTAGKDGKYGTYDDGQPQTVAEFDDLIKLISSQGAYPFIWSGENSDYTTPVFSGMFANYEGPENFKTFFDYNGEYTFDGESAPTQITLANGYNVYRMTGLYKSLEFMNKYMNNNLYVHPSALETGSSHTDAQGKFLTGYKGSGQNPQAAFLCECTWWENEAKSIFNSISSDAGRGYGQRDYRFLVFPDTEGEKGADGNGNGTIFTAYDTSGFVVVKSDNEELMKKAEEFCAYTLKDKYLRRFTVLTGTARPYDYTLTEDDYAQLTPFAKSAMELYYDSENITVLRPKLLNLSTAISYGSTKTTTSMWYSQVDNVDYISPILALRSSKGYADAAKTVFEGFAKYYTSGKWSQYVLEAEQFTQLK